MVCISGMLYQIPELHMFQPVLSVNTAAAEALRAVGHEAGGVFIQIFSSGCWGGTSSDANSGKRAMTMANEAFISEISYSKIVSVIPSHPDYILSAKVPQI